MHAGYFPALTLSSSDNFHYYCIAEPKSETFDSRRTVALLLRRSLFLAEVDHGDYNAFALLPPEYWYMGVREGSLEDA